MRRWIGRIVIGIVLLVAGYLVGHRSVTIVHAQQSVSIPRAFGRYIGTMQGMLVFEDSSGTIRICNLENGNVEMAATRN